MLRNKNYSERINNSVKNLALKISGVVIPLLQYLPAMGIWLGFMSTPLIGFIALLVQYPFMFENAINIIFIDLYYGKSVFIFGMVFFLYSFIFQLYYHKKLIEKGPYKYFKHPQYITICLMTLGLTMLCYNKYIGALQPFTTKSISKIWIAITWVVEVFLYVILAKIENYSLKARYGDYYLDYTKSVKNRWEVVTNVNETEMRFIILAIVLILIFFIDFLIIYNL